MAAILTLLFALASGVAREQADAADPTAECWSKPTNYDTHNCLAAILGHEDDRLNRDYRHVIAALAPAQRERLRASERRWLIRLKRDCNAEAEGMSTGSMYPLYFDQCAIFATQERSAWLRQYAQRAR